MPRVAKVSGFGIMGMEVWTTEDGQRQPARVRMWKEEQVKVERLREKRRCGGRGVGV